MDTSTNEKIIVLNNNDILPNRFQPRKKFSEDELLELTESIKKYGILEPIIVRPLGDKYELVAGERRYKANVLSGNETIPVIIKNLSDSECSEIAIIENLQRKNLSAIEEALCYKRIIDLGYATQQQIAEKTGKSQSYIANKIRLLKLSDEVQDALFNEKISERHARSLLKIKNLDNQNKMLNRIINERLTVRKTDEEIDKMNNENINMNGNQIETTPLNAIFNDTPQNNVDNSVFTFGPDNQEDNNVGNTLMSFDLNGNVVDNNSNNNFNTFNEEPQTLFQTGTFTETNNDNTNLIDSNVPQMPSFNGEMETAEQPQIFDTGVTPQANQEMPMFREAQPSMEEPSFGVEPEQPQIFDMGVTPAPQANQEMPMFGEISQGMETPAFGVAPEQPQIFDTGVTPQANQEMSMFGETSQGMEAPSFGVTPTPQVNQEMPMFGETQPSMETPSFGVAPEQPQIFDTGVTPTPQVNQEMPMFGETQPSMDTPSIGAQEENYQQNNDIDVNDNISSIPTTPIFDGNQTVDNISEFKKPEPIIVADYDKQYDPVMPEQNDKTPDIDFKTIINLIRQCSDTIEKCGYKIDTEEYDLENMYQVTFKIDKM